MSLNHNSITISREYAIYQFLLNYNSNKQISEILNSVLVDNDLFHPFFCDDYLKDEFKNKLKYHKPEEGKLIFISKINVKIIPNFITTENNEFMPYDNLNLLELIKNIFDTKTTIDAIYYLFRICEEFDIVISKNKFKFICNEIYEKLINETPQNTIFFYDSIIASYSIIKRDRPELANVEKSLLIKCSYIYDYDIFFRDEQNKINKNIETSDLRSILLIHLYNKAFTKHQKNGFYVDFKDLIDFEKQYEIYFELFRTMYFSLFTFKTKNIYPEDVTSFLN